MPGAADAGVSPGDLVQKRRVGEQAELERIPCNHEKLRMYGFDLKPLTGGAWGFFLGHLHICISVSVCVFVSGSAPVPGWGREGREERGGRYVCAGERAWRGDIGQAWYEEQVEHFMRCDYSTAKYGGRAVS